jgi:hypothetical protein
MTLAARVRRRVYESSLAALLRSAGQPVYCEVCGRELFRTLPFVIRGRVQLLGAREANVRVRFDSKERLRFSHLELDSCPSPERPWLR